MERSKHSASGLLTYPTSQATAGLRVRSCGSTDIGLQRMRNEDYFGLDDQSKTYLLADGMGGGPHGDLASRIAVETAHECIARSSPDTQASERIERAVLQARTRICDAILENAELNGMGTTLVGLLLEDHRRAVIAHVGDSRAYRLRGDRLEVLTQDHTMATALVREGHLTEREAVNHRLSHVLTRALCCEGRCEVEITKASVAAGDLFLLCSDGLSNMLSAEEILALLLDGRDTEETCERLIQAALSQGGNDNITVVLVEILEAGS